MKKSDLIKPTVPNSNELLFSDALVQLFRTEAISIQEQSNHTSLCKHNISPKS